MALVVILGFFFTSLTILLASTGSQHAPAVVVEVYEGAMSVLLPFQFSGFIPEDNPTVMWTRTDLHPKFVHLRREEVDDLRGQNQHYSGRTSMTPHALDTLDFSLTLKNLQLTDTGNYTCSISDGTEDWRLTDIQLHVKVIPVEVEVEEGAEFVQLPFKTTKNLPDDVHVIWERYNPFKKAHVFKNGSDKPEQQDEFYRDRTKLNKDLLKTGDLSLTLKQPTERDNDKYKCLVWRKGTFIRKKTVELKVKEEETLFSTSAVLCSSCVRLFLRVNGTFSGEEDAAVARAAGPR
ncbi:unnamed protein product [Oreochromis niloticus]|nr:unnamed protein product [Mustela putorius furo]